MAERLHAQSPAPRQAAGQAQLRGALMFVGCSRASCFGHWSAARFNRARSRTSPGDRERGWRKRCSSKRSAEADPGVQVKLVAGRRGARDPSGSGGAASRPDSSTVALRRGPPTGRARRPDPVRRPAALTCIYRLAGFTITIPSVWRERPRGQIPMLAAELLSRQVSPARSSHAAPPMGVDTPTWNTNWPGNVA